MYVKEEKELYLILQQYIFILLYARNTDVS